MLSMHERVRFVFYSLIGLTSQTDVGKEEEANIASSRKKEKKNAMERQLLIYNYKLLRTN